MCLEQRKQQKKSCTQSKDKLLCWAKPAIMFRQMIIVAFAGVDMSLYVQLCAGAQS